MMIKHRIWAVAMGMMLSGASSLAAADSAGFYFGATGGQSQADLDQDEFDAGVLDILGGLPLASASSDLDDSDVSFSLFGGYRFNPYISVEASYLDLGTTEYSASATTIDPPGSTPPLNVSYNADIEVSGFTAAAVFGAPLGQMFHVHGQAGVLFADTEISASAAATGLGSMGDSYSADSRDFFFGVGAGLNFGENWSVNLDWQRFKDVGDEDETGETDVDRIALGVIYRL